MAYYAEDNDLVHIFKDRLKETVQNSNTLEIEFSEIAGLNFESITKMMNSEDFLSLERASRIANIVPVSLDYLCGGDDWRPSQKILTLDDFTNWMIKKLAEVGHDMQVGQSGTVVFDMFGVNPGFLYDAQDHSSVNLTTVVRALNATNSRFSDL